MSTQWKPRGWCRYLLWSLALAGFVLVNGAFVYGILNPEVMAQALGNPIAMAFIAEAFLLLPLLAWLLVRARLTRMSWGWFIGLSLLGSIAFSLPLALLHPLESAGERA